MNKQEFIFFLQNKANEANGTGHWKKTYSNSYDHWYLYLPGVDWLEDTLDLSKPDGVDDGMVKLFTDKSLYDNDSTREFHCTYLEFMKNYDNACRGDYDQIIGSLIVDLSKPRKFNTTFSDESIQALKDFK